MSRTACALAGVLLAGSMSAAPPPAQTLEVTGRVVRTDGTPVGAASVYYYWAGAGDVARRRDVTDRKGRFRVRLPDEARAARNGTLEVHDASGRRCGVAVIDRVAPGATDVEIVTGPPRTVRVELRDAETGEPVKHGTRVRIEILRAGRWIRRGEEVVVEGAVPALRIPGGTFRLTAWTASFDPLVAGPFASDELAESLALEIEPLAELRGRVLAAGEPVAGARVAASVPRRLPNHSSRFSYGWTWSYDDETDEHGTFAIPIPGDVAMELEAEHPALGVARLAVPDLVAGEDRDGVELHLAQPGRLEGTLRLPEREREGDLAVFLFAGPRRYARAPLAADGSFVLERLAAGDWYARYGPADEPLFLHAPGLPPGIAPELERPPLSVRVEPGRTNRVVLDFEAPPLHRSIAGVVVHADLPPDVARRARTGLFGRRPDELQLVESATGIFLTAVARRRPDDLFELELYEPGPYELTLASPELPDWTFEATLELPPGETRCVAEIHTALLRFRPDERIGPATIDLAWRGPGGTAGRCTRSFGKAPVEVVVPAGELEVVVHAPSAEELRSTVRVAPGERLDLSPEEWR